MLWTEEIIFQGSPVLDLQASHSIAVLAGVTDAPFIRRI